MEQFIGFWDLTKEQQERLAADGMLNIRTFGKRKVLMNQDDDADNVGVMLSGTEFYTEMLSGCGGRMLRHFAFRLPGRFFERQKAVVGL